MKAQGSVGNEFREFVRKLQKLDRAPEREAKRRQRAEAKKRRGNPPVQPS